MDSRGNDGTGGVSPREVLNLLKSGVAVYEAVDGGEDFVFNDFNPAAEEIDRIHRSDVIGRRVTEVFPGVREFGLLAVLRRVCRTGVPERHPVCYYQDGRIAGWRDNQVLRLPRGQIVAIYEDRNAEREAQDRVDQLSHALLESEHRFRTTFEQAAVGMAHIGLDGRFLRFNDKLCEITGYSRDELQARTFQAITHPEDLNADLTLAQELWAGRIPHYRIAKRYIRRDGSVVWVNLTASAVMNDAGQPEYGIAVVEDITAQKAAERLRASEELQRMALSASQAGAWECDVSTGHQVWSPEAYGIYGLDPSAPPPSYAEWLQRCVHPDDRARLAAAMGQTPTETGAAFEVEFRALHPRKGQRWLMSLGRIIQGQDGGLQCYGLDLDITDRHEAREALLASEARLQMAMVASEIGIWEWEIGSGSTKLSENLKNTILPDDEPFASTYQAFREVVHPEDLPRVDAALAQAFSGEGDYRLEFRMLRADGSIRWSHARGALIRDPEGRPARMVGIDMDITDRKAAEARQALLASELNHRVKNLLATVSAIMRATIRTAPTTQAFQQSFSERLGALARGTDLLVRQNWESVELSAVLGGALGSFGEAVGISAPDRGARLTANGALALNLVLHELATNAAKYGALSTPQGRVTLACGLSEQGRREVTCHWREAGGPPVVPPARKGFGSTLIERSVRQDLRGRAAMNYAPEGFECVLSFPVEAAPPAARARAG